MSVKPPQQLTADAATVVSGGSASWAWLVHINEVLTLVATVIAIVSGLFAIRYYTKKKDESEGKD